MSLDLDLTVGRQALPGQVVLDHPNISRRHAALEVAGGTIVLRDLGRTNGTYVNGGRLRGARPLVAVNADEAFASVGLSREASDVSACGLSVMGCTPVLGCDSVPILKLCL